MRVALLTVVALVAFAANSVLCRAALGAARIDAASFSTIRLLSGAAVLVPLLAVLGRSRRRPTGSWGSAAFLLLYAVPFSFAYLGLATGTGALLLFGAVQATMLVSGLLAGERLDRWQWLGLAGALAGLVYLVSPGVEAPAPGAALLMGLAGVAWGFYSLRGRASGDPLADTAGNFLRTVPLVALVSLAFHSRLHLSFGGGALAVGSGALASGVGYAIWYAALGGLSATQAATAQLTVPAIAAAGGVLFMGEQVTARLLLSSALILGGVGLAARGRGRGVRKS